MKAILATIQGAGIAADVYPMADLVETRWKRFGQDRVYVKTPDGIAVGHVDLVAATVVITVVGSEEAMAECAQRWLCTTDTSTSHSALAQPADTATNLDGNASELSAHVLASSSAAIVSTESISGVDSATAKASEVERPSITVMDFGLNRAGAAVRAKRKEVNAEAPVLNLLARVFGVKTDERAWRVGAVGEERVGAELAKLGGEWKVIHAVEVGNRGSDIDHVVIGPAGVFTLNTKRHPGGKAWVGERTLMVNGQKVQYLRNSRHEAQRAQRMLSAACDREVVVRAAIVFVDLETFTVKQSPPDVDVTTRKRLAGWLRSLPVTLTFDEVEQIHTVARLSTTWLTKTP